MTDIFGTYYDEGRIARELDADFAWGVLDRESIESYKEITKQSGTSDSFFLFDIHPILFLLAQVIAVLLPKDVIVVVTIIGIGISIDVDNM